MLHLLKAPLEAKAVIPLYVIAYLKRLPSIDRVT
jgi:hypothetical protein